MILSDGVLGELFVMNDGVGESVQTVAQTFLPHSNISHKPSRYSPLLLVLYMFKCSPGVSKEMNKI